MVTGLDIFRRHFAGFEDSFVLIGGAACDLWFTRAGGRFRATRDIDMVLVLEAIQSRFFPHFWAFIRSGRYQTGQRSDGERTYFRFLKPVTAGYPAMIELLSTAPVTVEIARDQHIAPIPAGTDISSLSAILLDPDYYQFIMGQRDMLEGLPLIKPAGLIALKARAWVDLRRRRDQNDASVKGDDVNKHRSDIFRLAAILPTGEGVSLPGPIFDDLRVFVAAFPETSSEWPAIAQALAETGIRISPPDLLATLRTYFRMAP